MHRCTKKYTKLDPVSKPSAKLLRWSQAQQHQPLAQARSGHLANSAGPLPRSSRFMQRIRQDCLFQIPSASKNLTHGFLLLNLRVSEVVPPDSLKSESPEV